MPDHKSAFLLTSLTLAAAATVTPARAATVVTLSPFTVVSVTTQQRGALQDTTYVIQNGSDPTSLFGIERITPPAGGNVLPALILEPPLGGGAAFYTRGDAAGGGDFEHSIAADIARGGVDVYLISSRETFLTPNECSAQGSCAFAAGWGFSAFLDDLKFIRALVAADHKAKPAIGGASLGGIIGIAAVNESPLDYSGLVLMDSTLWTNDTTLRAGYNALCQETQAAIAAGLVVSPFGVLEVPFVTLELSQPNAPTPFTQFPAGTTNRQAYLIQLTSPSPGPPNSLFPPGTVGVAGSVAQNKLFFASEDRINTKAETDDFYAANAIARDFVCSMGGDTTFVGQLSQYRGPIMAFEDGQGLGALADDVIALTASRDVDKIVYANFGHSDLTETASHAADLDIPTIAWLYSDVLGGDSDGDSQGQQGQQGQ